MEAYFLEQLLTKPHSPPFQGGGRGDFTKQSSKRYKSVSDRHPLPWMGED